MVEAKKSTAFKRAKVVKEVRRVFIRMNEAKREWEDYELRKRTAAGPEAERYYAEMCNLYQGKYTALNGTLSNMVYEFGITDDEISGEGEGV